MELAAWLLIGMGLAFALEGAFYALAPEAMKRFAAMVALEKPGRLRMAGLFAAGAGVLLVWIGRAL